MPPPYSVLCSWCGTRVDPVTAPIHPSCGTEKAQWQALGYPLTIRIVDEYRRMLGWRPETTTVRSGRTRYPRRGRRRG